MRSQILSAWPGVTDSAVWIHVPGRDGALARGMLSSRSSGDPDG